MLSKSKFFGFTPNFDNPVNSNWRNKDVENSLVALAKRWAIILLAQHSELYSNPAKNSIICLSNGSKIELYSFTLLPDSIIDDSSQTFYQIISSQYS